MLRPRITPCLLVEDGALIKTVGFAPGKYVGDPLNAVRIFNEKEVDEITVLDISATRRGREPDYALVRNLASECRMPLCYGGGVRTAVQVEALVGLGVEKVAIGAACVEAPQVLGDAAARVGSQSVVAVMDVRKRPGGYEVFIRNGTQATGLSPASFIRNVQAAGVGEVLINSIDRDGTMGGYDLELVGLVRAATSLPVTALGGAGSLADLRALVGRFGTIGAAAGSLFVFKGKYRAVLINYPNPAEKETLVAASMESP